MVKNGEKEDVKLKLTFKYMCMFRMSSAFPSIGQVRPCQGPGLNVWDRRDFTVGANSDQAMEGWGSLFADLKLVLQL